MKTLKQTKIGETVKVVKLHGEGAVKRRWAIRSRSPCAAMSSAFARRTPRWSKSKT